MPFKRSPKLSYSPTQIKFIYINQMNKCQRNLSVLGNPSWVMGSLQPITNYLCPITFRLTASLPSHPVFVCT